MRITTNREVRVAGAQHASGAVPLAITAALVWLCACQNGSSSSTQLPVPTQTVGQSATVRVGRLAGTDPLIQIGLHQGYFAEQGVQIDEVPFQSTQDMVAPLAAGQLDVGSGSFSAGFFNAVADGYDVKCVAGGAYTPPGHPANDFVVRTDLVAQIHTPSDLRGRTIGLTAHGVSPELDLGTFLNQAGLALGDVDEALLAFPAMVDAMAAGRIDVAIVPEPFALQMASMGIGTIWKGDDEIIPNQQVGCVLFAAQFVSGHPAAAQGYITAYLRSARDYDDAFIKRDPQARADVLPVLAATTNFKDPTLYDRMVGTPVSPDGQENLDSIQRYQDFFMASGLQLNRVDPTRFIDTHFAEAALQAIGPYQP